MKSESLVRRKGVQCEVAHRRERADLARAHRGAAEAGAKAQRVSERFWKEVTQPTRTHRGAGSPHPTGAPPEERLARARALQAQLVTARGAHATAQAAVGVHGARVVQADALQRKVQTLAADLQRRAVAQRSERHDDALADQLATCAARVPLPPTAALRVGGAPRSALAALGAAQLNTPATGRVDQAGLPDAALRQRGADRASEPEFSTGGERRAPAELGLPRAAALVVAPAELGGRPQPQAASAAAAAPVGGNHLGVTAAAAPRIEQVELDHAPTAVTVRVQCALSCGAAVQVALTQGAGGALSAVVESPNLALAAQMKRERAALVAKLGARGVVVESLEVRAAPEGAQAVAAPAGQPQRRRGIHGSEDEFMP